MATLIPKRFKIMDEGNEDRISSLPEWLLLEIISRIKIQKRIKIQDWFYDEEERIMTTKEVIKTTATISKRWQHLWTKLPNLIFADGGLGNDLTDYLMFIDKTITQCSADVNLNKFDLEISYDGKVNTQVNSWIRRAITRKVQEVNLRIWDVRTSEKFSYDDELFFNNSCITRMKISFCEFIPSNGAIRWDKLMFLYIHYGKLDDASIGKILSGSPCLETLELDNCYGFRRIDITSKRFKNLVLRNHGSVRRMHIGEDYIDSIEINAPYMLSLTIKGKMCLEKLLLLNVSSLVRADLNYLGSNHFADQLGRTRDDIEEDLLRGLLSSVGHVNDITLGDYNCLQALKRLKDNGFQLFRVGADADEDRVPELIASGRRKVASRWRKREAETKKEEKVEEKEDSDDDMGYYLFD